MVPTPVPTLTYAQQYFWRFTNESWNFANQAPILYSVIGDFFGRDGNTIVYGTILITIIGLIWVRQEDAAIPLFMMFILSNILFWTPGIIPDDWVWTLRSAMYLVIAGIAYTWWRGRRLS